LPALIKAINRNVGGLFLWAPKNTQHTANAA
jgi:hypothetical protein